MSDERSKEVAEEYLSSLTDLNINSKPLITMLTMLAEENIEHASVIVDTIEKQIHAVAPDFKLPLLYLIDSIVKNVAGEYRTLFTKKIASIFCDVFSKVNEVVRSKMFTLRQTWNDVFPQTKMYTLDVKVRYIDPGWPITANPMVAQKPAIHVNPKFLNNRSQEALTVELQQKQIELLELEKKKKELEKVVSKQTDSVKNQNRVPAVGEVPVPISSLPPIPKISRDPRLAKSQGAKFSPKSGRGNKASGSGDGSNSKKSDSRRNKADSPRSRDPRQRSSKGGSNSKNGVSPAKGGRDKSKRQRSPSSRPLKRSREKSPESLVPVPSKRPEDKAWTHNKRERKTPTKADVLGDVDLRMPLAPKDVDFRNLQPVETMEISDGSDSEQPKGLMDDLFGNKDLDLRTLNAPPAPVSRHQNSKNRLMGAREKLAVVSKQKDKLGRPLLYNQLSQDPLERKLQVSNESKPASGDVDFRQILRPNLHEEDLNQSMQIIITQAQEELANNKITASQFKELVQQCWDLNEAKKKRRESVSTPALVNPWATSVITGTSVVPLVQPQPIAVTPVVQAVLQPTPAPVIPMQPMQPVASDSVKTINIDGIPREIRFYDETAVIFMSNDDPRKIGFENGSRLFTIHGAEPALLHFNDEYKPIMVNGTVHQVRFGAPSRELYIDRQPYECLFGGPPLPILINGVLHTITVDGPEPKVKIGDKCLDLVLGRVQMIIDGMVEVDVYLDSHLQTFEYNNSKHTLQLADHFETVVIDGVPLRNVEYGGLPRTFKLGNKKSFLRFSTLPKGVLVGQPTVIAPPAPEPEEPPAVAREETEAPALKIDDLLQKLLSSGLIQPTVEKKKERKQREATPPPVKRVEEEFVVDLSRLETVKRRNGAAVESLFSGMQCSSCGVRFPPEQTMKYSQHLDWHFRQNRRDRDASKRAHSRKWYYDVSDWIQYEEIEDLEEREQNWFEKHGANIDLDEEESQNSPKAATIMCAAGPKGADETCEVCHDRFEYFFNEETEDWNLKNAMRTEDGKTYHPTCFEDLQASEERKKLEADEPMEETEKPEEVTDPNEEEYVPEDTKMEDLGYDLDDDVIALSPQKPTITEILDDDDAENGYRLNEIEDTTVDSPKIETGKREPEKEEEEVIDTTAIKVKEEKLDETYEAFDPFEDVGTIEVEDPDTPLAVDDEEETSRVTPILAVVEESQPATTPSAEDPNLSLTYAPPITVNKIRINIAKPLTTTVVAVEPRDEESESAVQETAFEKPEDEPEPTFEFKPSMAGVSFRRVPKHVLGSEVSGLCSIM